MPSGDPSELETLPVVLDEHDWDPEAPADGQCPGGFITSLELIWTDGTTTELSVPPCPPESDREFVEDVSDVVSPWRATTGTTGTGPSGDGAGASGQTPGH